MDPGGRKARIMPGQGFFVPGRKRTENERSQGNLSRPTTMTSPVLRPSRRVAPNETLSPLEENTKIVGTNSTSRLESTKHRKNELKTNPERTAKQAEISTLTTRNRLNEADLLHVSVPQPTLDFSTRIRENKARMSLKTKDRQVEKSRSQGVEELGSRSKGLEVGCRRFVTLRLSTLDFSTRICQNKARMSLKTKDRHVS